MDERCQRQVALTVGVDTGDDFARAMEAAESGNGGSGGTSGEGWAAGEGERSSVRLI